MAGEDKGIETIELSPRDLHRAMGLMFLGTLMAACAPRAADLSPIEAQATAQANLSENQRIERFFPKWLLSGLGRITISSLSDGTMQEGDSATGQVLYETPEHLVFLTAEHVAGNFYWKTVTLDFPYGYTNRKIFVDARLGTENWVQPTDKDWSIDTVTEDSPIRAIVIRKPKGFTDYVTRPEYRLVASTPQQGEKYYIAGFPKDTGGAAVFSELIFQGETKATDIPDVHIPLFEFSGVAGEGMSGGPIIKEDGSVVALLSRGKTIGSKSMAWGIPFKDHLPKLAF